jgi:hypothetical protein
MAAALGMAATLSMAATRAWLPSVPAAGESFAHLPGAIPARAAVSMATSAGRSAWLRRSAGCDARMATSPGHDGVARHDGVVLSHGVAGPAGADFAPSRLVMNPGPPDHP